MTPIPLSPSQVQRLLRERDPLGRGLPNLWAVKLVRRLLAWRSQVRVCTPTHTPGTLNPHSYAVNP